MLFMRQPRVTIYYERYIYVSFQLDTLIFYNECVHWDGYINVEYS